MAVVQDLELRAIVNFHSQLKLVFKGRKKSVAVASPLDISEKKIGAERQGFGINLAPAAYKNVALVPGIINFLQAGGDLEAAAFEQAQFRLIEEVRAAF